MYRVGRPRGIQSRRVSVRLRTNLQGPNARGYHLYIGTTVYEAIGSPERILIDHVKGTLIWSIRPATQEYDWTVTSANKSSPRVSIGAWNFDDLELRVGNYDVDVQGDMLIVHWQEDNKNPFVMSSPHDEGE